MAFDPSKPFTLEGESNTADAEFDPSKPFEIEVSPKVDHFAQSQADLQAMGDGLSDDIRSLPADQQYDAFKAKAAPFHAVPPLSRLGSSIASGAGSLITHPANSIGAGLRATSDAVGGLVYEGTEGLRAGDEQAEIQRQKDVANYGPIGNAVTVGRVIGGLGEGAISGLYNLGETAVKGIGKVADTFSDVGVSPEEAAEYRIRRDFDARKYNDAKRPIVEAVKESTGIPGAFSAGEQIGPLVVPVGVSLLGAENAARIGAGVERLSNAAIPTVTRLPQVVAGRTMQGVGNLGVEIADHSRTLGGLALGTAIHHPVAAGAELALGIGARATRPFWEDLATYGQGRAMLAEGIEAPNLARGIGQAVTAGTNVANSIGTGAAFGVASASSGSEGESALQGAAIGAIGSPMAAIHGGFTRQRQEQTARTAQFQQEGSKPYGDEILDKQHADAMAQLPPRDQMQINAARGLYRGVNDNGKPVRIFVQKYAPFMEGARKANNGELPEGVRPSAYYDYDNATAYLNLNSIYGNVNRILAHEASHPLFAANDSIANGGALFETNPALNKRLIEAAGRAAVDEDGSIKPNFQKFIDSYNGSPVDWSALPDGAKEGPSKAYYFRELGAQTGAAMDAISNPGKYALAPETSDVVFDAIGDFARRRGYGNPNVREGLPGRGDPIAADANLYATTREGFRTLAQAPRAVQPVAPGQPIAQSGLPITSPLRSTTATQESTAVPQNTGTATQGAQAGQSSPQSSRNNPEYQKALAVLTAPKNGGGLGYAEADVLPKLDAAFADPNTPNMAGDLVFHVQTGRARIDRSSTNQPTNPAPQIDVQETQPAPTSPSGELPPVSSPVSPVGEVVPNPNTSEIIAPASPQEAVLASVPVVPTAQEQAPTQSTQSPVEGQGNQSLVTPQISDQGSVANAAPTVSSGEIRQNPATGAQGTTPPQNTVVSSSIKPSPQARSEVVESAPAAQEPSSASTDVRPPDTRTGEPTPPQTQLESSPSTQTSVADVETQGNNRVNQPTTNSSRNSSSLTVEDVARIREEAKAAHVPNPYPRSKPESRTAKQAADLEEAQRQAVLQAHAAVQTDPRAVQLRVDPETGRETFSGAYLSESDPVHAEILSRLDDDTRSHLSAIEEAIANKQPVNFDYMSADTTGTGVTGKGRRMAQSESTAQSRAEGDGAVEEANKLFYPYSISVSKSGTVQAHGFSPDKLIQNAERVLQYNNDKGNNTLPYRTVNDPQFIRDYANYAENHANGFKGNGEPLVGTDAIPVTPTEGYQPHVIPQDRADFLNLVTQGSGDQLSNTPRGQSIREFAKANGLSIDEASREVNALRAQMNAAGDFQAVTPDGIVTGTKKVLNDALFENVRPDLITRVYQERESVPSSNLRAGSFAGDRRQLTAKGNPSAKIAGAGFLPAERAGASTSEQIAEAGRLWKEKGTDSPLFKAWSSNAPIISNPAKHNFEAGKPFVVKVFHGAPDVHPIFDQGFRKFSRGDVYFATDSERVANTYADPQRAFDYQSADEGAIPLYVALQNPMVIDAKGKLWKGTQAEVQKAKEAGYDGIVIRNSLDDYQTSKASKPSTVFAFFDPSQAKSAVEENMISRLDRKPIAGATANRGTFNPQDPRIGYLPASTGQSITDNPTPYSYSPLRSAILPRKRDENP